MRRWSCIIALSMGCQFGLQTGVIAQPTELSVSQDHLTESPTKSLQVSLEPVSEELSSSLAQEFNTFPVGVNIGRRNVIESTFVRGREDGSQAVNFGNWLLPFEVVIAALQFKVTPLANGQLELRSPGLVTRIDPDTLPIDPELGLAISIQMIETLFGVPSKFDINEYAVILTPSWLATTAQRSATGEVPILLEGLPEVAASSLALGTVGQEVKITGNDRDSDLGFDTTNYQGNLEAVGTLLGGSWFIRTSQVQLEEPESWKLSEFQYFRPTDTSDYILASQPRFWPNSEREQYWGVTTIQRWGFTPPPP